jgi:hypothetical protein
LVAVNVRDQIAACHPDGGMRCDGQDVQTGSDPPAGWSTSETCGGGDLCAQAACVGNTVLPAGQEQTYLALVKPFVDCWATGTPGI